MRWLITFAMALLIGCGGGGGVSGGGPVYDVAWYSASDGTGMYYDDVGQLRAHEPDPVQMVNAAGTLRIANRSINGLQLAELLAGGSVAFGTPGHDQVTAFEQQLASESSPIVVIGAGMADCILAGLAVPEYLTLVDRAVSVARAAGKVPVLRGFNRFASTAVMTEERLARRDACDAALQARAGELGVPLLDVGSVPFLGPADIRADGMHAMPAYNQRIAEYVAPALAQLVSNTRR